MAALSERLEALSSLGTKVSLLSNARAPRSAPRVFHLDAGCSRFRASYRRTSVAAGYSARRLCPVCFASWDGSEEERRFLGVRALEAAFVLRETLLLSEVDRDSRIGEVLRLCAQARSLAGSAAELDELAAEVAESVRVLLPDVAVSDVVREAAELAFLLGVAAVPSAELVSLLGGSYACERFVSGVSLALLESLPGSRWDAAVREQAALVSGERPYQLAQLPSGVHVLPEGLPLQEALTVVWAAERDRLAVAEVASWLRAASSLRVSSERICVAVSRCDVRGDLLPLSASLGALRYPDRYLVVFPDLPREALPRLRELLNREAKVEAVPSMSVEALEVAVGLFDASSVKLSSFRAAAEAAVLAL